MKRLPFFKNPVLQISYPMWRGRLILIFFGLCFFALAARAIYLQGITTEFLQQQGEKRYEQTLTLHASRGKILDRHGVVLAASIPANAIAFQPKQHRGASAAKMQSLADLLEIPVAELKKKAQKLKTLFLN
jgi:cell division protein FtsI (penicillin-binding protein 3)